jgi:hypothetical protein
MTKNVIIEKIVDSLLQQRKDLSYELGNLNHNEATFLERRTTLESAIYNIDMQIDRRVMDCELTVK